MTTQDGFETLAIHAGQEPDPRTGAVVPPIYQVSTFKQDGVAGCAAATSTPGPPTRPGRRWSSAWPRSKAGPAGARLRLRHGRGGLPAQDGCSPGDHVLVPDDAYGGTYRLFARVLGGWGLSHGVVPISDRRGRARAARRPADPAGLGRDADEPAAEHRRHPAPWPRPRTRPARCSWWTTRSPRRTCSSRSTLGADAVVHSTTKYLGGHSDVVGGAVVVADAELAERLAFTQNATGARARPVRLLADAARHQDPGRADGPALRERRASRADAGRAPGRRRGALPGVAIAPRPQDRAGADAGVRRHGVVPGAGRRGSAVRACGRTRLFTLGESLGGVESLIEHPARMTHASVTGSALEVPGDLIRLSVGIEECDDLIADLRQALSDG